MWCFCKDAQNKCLLFEMKAAVHEGNSMAIVCACVLYVDKKL